jgi:hypothetical protein
VGEAGGTKGGKRGTFDVKKGEAVGGKGGRNAKKWGEFWREWCFLIIFVHFSHFFTGEREKEGREIHIIYYIQGVYTPSADEEKTFVTRSVIIISNHKKITWYDLPLCGIKKKNK